MATLWEDFRLGLAGLNDLASRADNLIGLDLVPDTYEAAEVYSSQTAAAAGSLAEKQRLFDAAVQATDGGALEQAADQTVRQVGEKLDSARKTILFIAGVAGLLALAYVVSSARQVIR